jgi:WD40 repeat protein
MVKELKHTSPLLGCRFDPSGQFVFAGAQDNAVVRWNLETGAKTVLSGHKSWVRGLAFAGRGGVPPPSTGKATTPTTGGGTPPLLFSGDYAGRLLAWTVDAEKPAAVRTVEAHRGWVRALAVSPDGKTLATCGNDGLVKLWSVPDTKLIRELQAHDCHVYNTAFHPDGRRLISADLKGVVKVWDLSNGTVERELDAKILHKYDPSFMADIGGVRGMAVSADGALLACAGITDVSNAFAGVGKPLVVLFDWASGKQKLLLRPRENFQGTAWGTFIHPSGFVAGVGGGNGGVLWFWKPAKAQDFFALKLPDNGRDLDLHPDGHRLAVAFAGGAVRVYDMAPAAAK